MRYTLFALFIFIFVSAGFTQNDTARLQVIHNAADPAAEIVDIYVNGDMILDDFAFRAASAFVDVPAEVTINIGIAAGNSGSVSDTMRNFPVMFATGETYVAMATGVLDPTRFAPNPDGRDIGFTIFNRDMIREAGTDPMNVDFIVAHGVTDAPTVDVLARGVGQLVDDAAYGDITPYLSVPAQDYILDLTPANDNATVFASFEAALSGLENGAAVVFASGFLNPFYPSNPGLRGPGYWKNHPDSWPDDYIEIGGINYSKSDAIGFMGAGRGDMSYVMFMHLVAAKLNVLIGNDFYCVENVIDQADNWMTAYPVGSDVPANSSAWQTAEDWKDTLDAYNNGQSCSPSSNPNDVAFGLFAALPNGDVVEFPAVAPPAQPARLQVIHNAADPDAEVVDIYVNGDKFLDDFAFRTATPFVDVPAEVELSIGVAPGNSDDAGDIIATFPVTLASGGKYIAVANGVLGDGFAANPDGKDIAFTLFTSEDAREASLQDNKFDLKVLHGATDAPTVNILGYGIFIKEASYGDITDYISVQARENWLVVYVPGPARSLVGVYEADLSGLGGGAAFVFASGFVNPDENQNGASFSLFAALPDGNVIELPEVLTNNKIDIANSIMMENGFGEINDIGNFDGDQVVTEYRLIQNYPNPFNPVTKIRFALPEAVDMSLKIYDLSGQFITELMQGMRNAGTYEIEFDASHFSSGVYLYVLEAGNFKEVKRMTLVK